MKHRRLLACLLVTVVIGVVCFVVDSIGRLDVSRPKESKQSEEKDRDIVLSEQFENVENGFAYDRAYLDITGYTKLVIPHSATMEKGKPDELRIYMKKILGFGGRPGSLMSIRQSRMHMGCAVRTDGKSLFIASFGEWSEFEGGAAVELHLIVPEKIVVKRMEGLSGSERERPGWKGTSWIKQTEAQRDFWYEPPSPSDGWKAVPALPDPNRRADLNKQ